MKFNGNITLNALGQSEIQNLVVERLGALPTFQSSEAGRLVYNTADKLFYMNTGLAWVALATGGDAAQLQTEVDALEASLGSAITSTGGFNAGALTVSATSLTDAINQLSDANAAKALSQLVDVVLSSPATGQFLRFDAVSGKWVNHTPVLADVTDVTATAAEVNYLSGVTSGVQGQIDAVKSTADNAASGLAQEITDRQAADTSITTSLNDEVTRAEGIEAGLRTDLNAEIANRTQAVSDEATARSAADASLQIAVDSKVSKAGDTMTGQLAMGGNKVIGLGAPTQADDAVNKNYVDSLITGLTWEAPVDRIVANHATETGLAVGQRVVDTTDNKIYTVTVADVAATDPDGIPNSGDETAAVPASFDAGEVLVQDAAFFHKGDEQGFVFNGTSLVQFTGTGQVAAGIGLSKVGNQLDVNLGAGIAQLPTDEVGVDVFGSGGLFLTVDGSTSSTDTAAQLSVKLDGATLSVGVNGVKVSDATIQSIADNTTAINNETTRAEGIEAGLRTDLNAEITRAEGIEAGLRTDLDAEVTRAEGIEAGLRTDLNAEVTRAQAAEADLSAKMAKGYFLYDGAELTSHTVAHNIGSQFCNVTVIDSATNEQVIPQAVVFDSATSLTVSFNVALACKVVVMGLGV